MPSPSPSRCVAEEDIPGGPACEEAYDAGIECGFDQGMRAGFDQGVQSGIRHACFLWFVIGLALGIGIGTAVGFLLCQALGGP